MVDFEQGAEFAIGFDEKGNIIITGGLPILPGHKMARLPIIGFSDFQDARNFGQTVIDFCNKYEAKVPDVFLKGLGTNGN